MTSAFLEQCSKAIGRENVTSDSDALTALTRNVGGFERSICGCLRPGSTEEVQRIVQVANEQRQPLYPISTGMNWGIGSRLPVENGAVVVDLSRMNRIRDFNETHGYAVVEPGVTQRQLYAHLVARQAPFMLNATGASADSSIIGNMVDRGVGSLAPRVTETSALEVVLGTGEVLRTGFGHYATSRVTHLFPYGVGPALDGLFAQSSFGIVTSASVALKRRPEELVIASAKIKNAADLAAAADALAELCREGMFFTAARIGNCHRSEVALAPLLFETCVRREGLSNDAAHARVRSIIANEVGNYWSILGGIGGTRPAVREAARRIRRRLRQYGPVTMIPIASLPKIRAVLHRLRFIPAIRRKSIFVDSAEPALRLLFGEPTSAVVKSVYWPVRVPPKDGWENPDRHADIGLLYVCPIIPLEGSAVVQVAETTERVFASHGFVAYITMNDIGTKSMECVINLSFDRSDPERLRAAHRCIEEAQKAYVALGFMPYRTSIQLMHQLVSPDDNFWRLTREMKRVFDPNEVIAPGRYCLSTKD